MKNKSIIAKLLSEEDIFVVNKQTKTAAFNVETRELVLPIWKDEMSNEVADLFVCHEIGHALYTSKEMLHKMIERKLDKSYVNVIEDARIEKMVQEKYLGTKSVFKRGYNELVVKDFFGTKGKNLLDLNLIDRINIHFKGMDNVPFHDAEKIWVEKVANVKTEDEVLNLAEELAKYIEENEESQEQNSEDDKNDKNDEVGTNKSSSGGSDENEEQGSGSSGGSDENDENGEEENNSDEGSDEEVENSDEKTEESSSGTGIKGGDNYKHSAKTDISFNDKMEKSRDLDAKDRFYSRIPKVKLENVIISNKTVMEICKKNYGKETIGSGEAKFYNKTKQEVEKFQQDSKKVISYMVKEFEMKKAADQYARASTAKTGVLDMGSLHTYKYNDDLFLKVTSLPGATNHGMVMFLDWSGSMAPNFTQTLKQLYNLVWFCDRVKIPYVVYAFTDRYAKIASEYDENKENKSQDFTKGSDVCIEDVRLLEMFSSNMNKKETAEMMHYTHMMGEYYIGYRNWREDGYPISPPRKFELGGTPLNAAIIAAMDILPEFKKNTMVQKVNAVFLTDGESFNLDHTCSGSYTNSYEGIAVITDPATNETVIQDEKEKNNSRNRYYGNDRCETQTTMLLKLLKKRVYGMNILGFFVAGSGKRGIVKRDIICWKMGINEYAETDKLKEYQKTLRKDKVLVCKSQGYDEYYILPTVPKDDEEEEQGLQVKEGAKTGELKRAFAKFSSSKTLNRQLLNKFIEKVA